MSFLSFLGAQIKLSSPACNFFRETGDNERQTEANQPTKSGMSNSFYIVDQM